jgi:hypothetical protein
MLFAMIRADTGRALRSNTPGFAFYAITALSAALKTYISPDVMYT